MSKGILCYGNYPSAMRRITAIWCAGGFFCRRSQKSSRKYCMLLSLRLSFKMKIVFAPIWTINHVLVGLKYSFAFIYSNFNFNHSENVLERTNNLENQSNEFDLDFFFFYIVKVL